MNRLKSIALALLACNMLITSGATITGGQITESQKNKPAKGEAKRKIKPVPLIVGIVTAPLIVGAISLIVDFSTKAIYKPTESQPK